jgi:lipoprotein-releasing system permease protein
MGNDLYHVSGVFRTGLPGLDAFQALTPIDVLQEILVLDAGRVHEIGIDAVDVNAAPEIARGVAESLSALGGAVVAEPWTVFRRELYEYVSLASAANAIIVAIIFAMAIFGVANTMLMATYERRKEFAVVRALGATPGSVAGTVVIEALVLGVVALLLGSIVTTPVMIWVHAHPIDLSRFAEDMRAAGSVMRPVIGVAYSIDGPLISAVALMITSLLAALFPAYRAVRIPPADALAGR